MSIHLLWTSADSLIVAFALAFIVPQPHVLPLILMFGACDALGSALGVTMPVAGGLAAIAVDRVRRVAGGAPPHRATSFECAGLALCAATAAGDRQSRVAHA